MNMSIKLHSHEHCNVCVCVCVCRSYSVIIDNELFLSFRVLNRGERRLLILRRTTIFIHRNSIICVLFHATTTCAEMFRWKNKLFKWWCVFDFISTSFQMDFSSSSILLLLSFLMIFFVVVFLFILLLSSSLDHDLKCWMNAKKTTTF